MDEQIRREVDLQVDGGELPGTASTVIDLTRYEDAGRYAVVREGTVAAPAVDQRLRGV